MSLQSIFNPRHNALNALRLGMALMVIVSHSSALGAYGPELAIGGETLGRWAVFGFFGLSGFLITRSRLSARRVRDYYWARFLRIFPAFAVSLLVVAFVIAPLSPLIGSTGKYSGFDAISFVVHNLALYPPVLGQVTISDTLTNVVPFPDMWNGSLWTIWYETVCYILIGVLASIVPRRHLGKILVVSFAAATAIRLLSSLDVIGLGGYVDSVLPLAIAFMAGALLHIYAGRFRADAGFAVIAVALLSGIIFLQLAGPLAALPFTYLLIVLGQVLPLKRIGSKYDISYGVYIYAWPVQQCLALAFPHQAIPYWVFVAATIAMVVPLAWLSCRFVEQPAMRLKKRFSEKSVIAVPVPS